MVLALSSLNLQLSKAQARQQILPLSVVRKSLFTEVTKRPGLSLRHNRRAAQKPYEYRGLQKAIEKLR